MYTQRARRIALPISIMYRRAGEEDWHPSKVVNLSESGVLFGPTELTNLNGFHLALLHGGTSLRRVALSSASW